MKIFVIVLLLSLSSVAKDSSSSFTVSGVIKEILQVKVSQINTKLYNAQVTSNLPDGFKFVVEHDGVIYPGDEQIKVAQQTTGAVFNFPIRFYSAPSFIIVNMSAD